MTIPNYIHRIVLSLLFSITNWKIIDTLLIDIPFWKYFLIEISILVMSKMLMESYNRFDLHDKEEEE